MGISDYKDLIVWQKSMSLAKEIYRLVRLLPKEELYALSDQMRRAAVSIPSNIAEGYNRGSDKELLQFLRIARGSRAELETQILIAIDLDYFDAAAAETALSLCDETGRLINGFITKLNIRPNLRLSAIC